jgi:hypothetical protein
MTLNVNVKLNPYRASGNGVTDDRAAIQAAINAVAAAGGGCVYFPAGVYIIGAEPGTGALGGLQMMGPHVLLQGEAPRASVLQLANSTNRYLLYGPSNVDSLWGTNSSAGIENWSLLNMEFNGNSANNTSGNGIWIYGWLPIVQNVFIRNIAQNAWRSEGGAGASTFSFEGAITNVKIDTCGQHGFWFGGPSDSVLTNIIVKDAGQSANNTYDAIHLDNSASRFYSAHSWHSGGVTNRTRYGLYDAIGGSTYVGCQFEGSNTNVCVSGQRSIFSACQIFAAANGVNVLIRTTETIMRGISLGGALSGGPAVKGVVLGQSGDWVAANDIDIWVTDQNAGAVDFTNSSGTNSLRVRGFQPSGTAYVGSPNSTDDVDLITSGSSGATLRQTGGGEQYTSGFLALSESDGISAAGSSQGTATQLPNSSACQVTAVAAGTGVILPSNSMPGKIMYVHNSGANALLVYPASGQQINTLATNAPFTIGTNKGTLFIYNSSRWMACLSA